MRTPVTSSEGALMLAAVFATAGVGFLGTALPPWTAYVAFGLTAYFLWLWAFLRRNEAIRDAAISDLNSLAEEGESAWTTLRNTHDAHKRAQSLDTYRKRVRDYLSEALSTNRAKEYDLAAARNAIQGTPDITNMISGDEIMVDVTWLLRLRDRVRSGETAVSAAFRARFGLMGGRKEVDD